jgi:hypothetical protein
LHHILFHRNDFEGCGFELPNITSRDGVTKLREWAGDWCWISGKLIPTKRFKKLKIEIPKVVQAAVDKNIALATQHNEEKEKQE